MSELVMVKFGIKGDVLGLNTVPVQYAATIQMCASARRRARASSH